jgi:hypothetical protein
MIETFTIHVFGETAPIAFPPLRPETYDPDLCWDEETGAWISVLVGGGRYNSFLVLVGSNDVGQGVIYYSPEIEGGAEGIPVAESYAIIGSDWNGELAGTLYIAGNHTAEFDSQNFTITNSTGNDGTYTCGMGGAFYNAGEDRTEIQCDPALRIEPVDGDLTVVV